MSNELRNLDEWSFLKNLNLEEKYNFYKLDGCSHRPPYSGDYDDMVEISQREFGITTANDPKPILATDCISSCVAFCGWSQKHKVGFLTHYDGLTELNESFGSLLYWISQSVQDLPTEFDVRLIQGDWSRKEIINFLKARLNMRADIAMKLVEEDIGGAMSKSIALDTRTGQTYSYDLRLNPKRRELTDLDIMMLISGRSGASLVYKPQELNK
jgi:hypothetical protein